MPNAEHELRIFATVDYQGTPVLSQATWRAKAGNAKPGEHPEIRDYLEDVRITVEKPDMVFQSSRAEHSHIFYRLSVGRDRFIGKHLAVVVKYVAEPAGTCGYISTLYLSRTVYTKGALLWPETRISAT
jgi:hypothetical protein